MTEATETAAPRAVHIKQRSEVVELDWPIEFEGKVWDKITVRRLTAQEVGAFVERLQDLQSGQTLHWPVCDCPDAVRDALDADDADKLDKVIFRFLPLRFRAATESEQTRGTGDDTQP